LTTVPDLSFRSVQMLRDIERERLEIEGTIGEMTLVDLLERNAERFGSLPAIRWSDGNGLRTLSWAAYRQKVKEVAAGLESLGIEKGDFVALMAGNRPEHVMGDLGAVFAGAVPVSMYNTLASQQVRYIADHCEAKVAILENEEYLDRWRQIRADLPALRQIIVMELPEDHGEDGVISWDELVERGKSALEDDPSRVARSATGVSKDDLATLIYTSGTTGTPKAVMISQRNVVWTLECIARSFVDIPEHVRLISYLPLAHIGERMASHYASLWYAGSVRYVPDLTQVAAAVGQTKPEVFFAVPRVWEKFHAGVMARLKETPNPRKRALALAAVELATTAQRIEQAGGRPGFMDRIKLTLFDRLVFSKIRDGLGVDELKLAISAAAPISADLLMFFRGIGVPVYELYGMTESSGPGTTNRSGLDRIGTVGCAMPGVEIATADDDEILIRGGLVTGGYYKDQVGTADAFGDDGWLRTGDLGRLDDDGFLTIIGRKKEIIITAGGKNVAPAKLENLVNKHALISQACVVGDGRRYLTLLVALDPDMAPGWAETQGIEYETFESFSQSAPVAEEIQRIVESANGEVARVEQARKWAIVPDAWSPETGELTPSLKMKRRVVLERYSVQIERLYAD